MGKGGNAPGMVPLRRPQGGQMPTPEQLQYLQAAQHAGVNMGQGGNNQSMPSSLDMQYLAMSL
jgi:hypothetical protein